MKKIFLLFIILVNIVYGGDIQSIKTQILNGEFNTALNNIKSVEKGYINDSYPLLKGHIYILQGKYEKAQMSYLACTSTYMDYSFEEMRKYILENKNMMTFYNKLLKQFPDKKNNLKKGLQLYKKTASILNKWHTEAPDRDPRRVYSYVLMGITPATAKELHKKGYHIII